MREQFIKLLKQKKMPILELAYKSQVSTATIYQLKSGKIKTVRPVTYKAIMETLEAYQKGE